MSAEVSVGVSTEQQENPFQANGELRKKADYILSHSRISRTEVQIVDPDSPLPNQTPSGDNDDSPFSPTTATPDKGAHGDALVAETSKVSFSSPADSSRTENGKAEAKHDQQIVVEAEVKKAETSADEHPQKAEQVKLKSKKTCSIL